MSTQNAPAAQHSTPPRGGAAGAADVDGAAEQLQQLAVKTPKQRKAQTDDEYLAQKRQFEASGPRVHTAAFFDSDDTLRRLDSSKKTDRVHMLHACEKAYFRQDYARCLELVAVGEALFGVQPADAEQAKAEFAGAGRRTKKSSKVERHVVELWHIKDACLRKQGKDAEA